MKSGNICIKRFVEKLATPRTILLTACVFAITVILVNTRMKPDFSYLTQTVHYSPEYAYELLAHIGSEGRSAHLLVLPADLIMVFCYTVSLIGLNYRLFSKVAMNRTLCSAVILSPFLLAVLQFVEIVSIFILIRNYPVQLFGLANWCNLVTIIKTVLTPICFIAPAIGWGLSLWYRRRVQSERSR